VFQVVFEGLQYCLAFYLCRGTVLCLLYLFLIVGVFVPEVEVYSFREAFDEEDEKLEAVDIHLPQFFPEQALVCTQEYTVGEFHFLPAQAGDVGEVVDVVVVAGGGVQVERDLAQQ
jgi:hypothetical protein